MSRSLAFAVASAAVLSAGCYVRADDHHHRDDSPGTVPGDAEVFEAVIDRGAEMDVVPGEGAGAFIEYVGEGAWRVAITCDTAVSGAECLWFVDAYASSSIVAIEPEDLESDDVVFRPATRAVTLEAYTGADFDGFSFETAAGVPVRFEVWLDRVADPRFVYWVGDGGLHRGAPGLPLELSPSEP